MLDSSIFDPEKLIGTLSSHKVRYVLIGALAARLQGFPRHTSDADISPAADHQNLENLAAALKELNSKIFTETVPDGLPFDCSAVSLKQADMWNLVTKAGRLDIAFKPAGTNGYDELIKKAVQFEIFGKNIYAASLEDIIKSKKAADRPQDRQDIIILNEILERRSGTT